MTEEEKNLAYLLDDDDFKKHLSSRVCEILYRVGALLQAEFDISTRNEEQTLEEIAQVIAIDILKRIDTDVQTSVVKSKLLKTADEIYKTMQNDAKLSTN